MPPARRVVAVMALASLGLGGTAFAQTLSRARIDALLAEPLVFLCGDCRNDILREGRNLPQRRVLLAEPSLREAIAALEAAGPDQAAALRHARRAAAAFEELDEAGAIAAIRAARRALAPARR